MRPLQRIMQATRIGRLSRRWLAAALIVAAAIVLAPGVGHVTLSQPRQSSQSAQSSQFGTASIAGTASTASLARSAPASCRGITPATFPATGFIADPARTQGGHLWWRRTAGGSVCIGTVVEFVRYNTTATKTWKVIIYSARHPRGQTVARSTFTLRRGSYFWGFRIRKAFPGLSAVCITADGSFGAPCVHFGPRRG